MNKAFEQYTYSDDCNGRGKKMSSNEKPKLIRSFENHDHRDTKQMISEQNMDTDNYFHSRPDKLSVGNRRTNHQSRVTNVAPMLKNG